MTEHLPGAVAWDDMLPVDDVAESIVSLSRLSKHVVVPQLILTQPGTHLRRA